MKRILLSAAVLLAFGSLFVASAQNDKDQKQKPTPEQRAEFKAVKIANDLLLDDEVASKFVPVYKAYKLELNAVNDKYRHAKRSEEMKGKPLSDKEVDTFIRNGFAKSREILDIRCAYYEKFLKILTPKQIKKMYDMEKIEADMAAHRRWEKNAGKSGGNSGKHPGNRSDKHHGNYPGNPQVRNQ